MTRIIIIAGGLPRSGKTQLGINMALEMVRKGRQVGYYQAGTGNLPIERLLRLPPYLPSQDRGSRSEIIRRGYQGVDITLPRLALSRWNAADGERLAALRTAHEALPGYDDFLIDLSGVTPRGVIACCRHAPLVLLVVTPDPRSLPETFAMLKVLQLNDFTGRALLIVNGVDSDDQAGELHARLADTTMKHLNREVPLLGAVFKDRQVTKAERLGQAFTSIFPDAQVTRHVVKLVDALDSEPAESAPHPPSLAAFWNGFTQGVRATVILPGNADLGDFEPDERAAAGRVVRQEGPGSDATTLLRFEGPLARLDHAIQGFSGVLHLVADDMLLLHDHLAGFDEMREGAGDWSVLDNHVLEMMLARVLNTLLCDTDRREQVCFQVEESPVDGQDENWLREGSYIKYIFLLPGQGEAIGRISRELERLPSIRHSQGQDGECLCEALSATRDACLSVINTPQGEIRVYFWHQPGEMAHRTVSEHTRDTTGSSLQNSPANGLLH